MSILNLQLVRGLLSEHKDKQDEISVSIIALCEYYLESKKVYWSDEKYDGHRLLLTICPDMVFSVGDTFRKHKSNKWTASIVNDPNEDLVQDFETKEEAMIWVESLAKERNFIVERE